MMKFFFVGFLVLLCCSGLPVLSQETVEATEIPDAELTPEAAPSPEEAPVKAWFAAASLSPLVGEPVDLLLTVEIPAEGIKLLSWPDFPIQWLPFMVRSVGEITETISGDKKIYRQTLTVILWEPGDHITPEIRLFYQTFDGESGRLEGTPIALDIPFLSSESTPEVTPEATMPASISAEATPEATPEPIPLVTVAPAFFSVPSVLKFDDLNLRPFKPPVSFFYLTPLMILGIVLASGAIFFGARRWLAARKAISLPNSAISTPGEAALGELNRLAGQNVSALVLYPQVADCLRVYIHARFAFRTEDMTTEELVDALHVSSRMSERLQRELHRVLEQADLVKFARFQPSRRSVERLLAVAHAWVLRAEGEGDMVEPVPVEDNP